MTGITMVAEHDIEALNAWLAKAGLRGEAESTLVNGFCERAVAADVQGHPDGSRVSDHRSAAARSSGKSV